MLLRYLLFCLSLFSIFLLPKVPGVIEWDQQVVSFFATHRDPEFTRVFWVITHIGGNWGFFAALLLPFLIFLIKRRFKIALGYLLGVGLLKWSVSGLKVLVARPRPSESLTPLNSFSMPSGHAANAVIIYGILLVFLLHQLKSGWARGLAMGFCFLMIFLTDLSRVYLGVHYPSDVLMGSLYTATGLWLLQGHLQPSSLPQTPSHLGGL